MRKVAQTPTKAKQCRHCRALALARDQTCSGCGGPLVRLREVGR